MRVSTLMSGAAVRTVVNGCSVELDGHAPVRADLVLAATGITPCSGRPRLAGAELYDDRVVVDEQMRTSVPAGPRSRDSGRPSATARCRIPTRKRVNCRGGILGVWFSRPGRSYAALTGLP
jgi:hypothetical protein